MSLKDLSRKRRLYINIIALIVYIISLTILSYSILNIFISLIICRIVIIGMRLYYEYENAKSTKKEIESKYNI